jgi:hypothetical protein
MSYSDVSDLKNDPSFQNRVTAACASEGEENPEAVMPQIIWSVAASPGFGDAWASAVAGGVPDPGRDPAVITDAQILSAVQPALAALNAGA